MAAQSKIAQSELFAEFQLFLEMREAVKVTSKAPAKKAPAKKVPTIACAECGKRTPKTTWNRKFCPPCAEARKEVASEAWKQTVAERVERLAEPEVAAKVSLRKQWNLAKADAKAARKNPQVPEGIPAWNIPALMTLDQALALGLLVDVKGTLTAKKARRARKAA